eukprot:scaffold131_cov174-Ochromonas_danica.AAC.10
MQIQFRALGAELTYSELRKTGKLWSEMRCHYEVLELPRDASPEDVKKQYKKLALKWHPDRNFGQEDMATANFKEISTAFTVLNDPHERKWYDDHRESILRGGNGINSDEDDEEHDEQEQTKANTSTNTNKKGHHHGGGYPVFGTSTSLPEEVIFFYSQWENYVSEMSFTWADEYNVLEAPNRQVKRAMEKENTKLRENARKEWITNIRSLVAFVKKRDPRMIHIEIEKANRKKEEESRKQAAKLEEQRRRKEIRERWKSTYEEDSEEQRRREEERKSAFLLADNEDDEDEEIEMVNGYREMEDDLIALSLQENQMTAAGDDDSKKKEKKSGGGGEGVKEEEEDQVEGEEDGDGDGSSASFHCAVCSKYFKSAAQLTQHTASKVHRKKVTEAQRKTPKSKSK